MDLDTSVFSRGVNCANTGLPVFTEFNMHGLLYHFIFIIDTFVSNNFSDRSLFKWIYWSLMRMVKTDQFCFTKENVEINITLN